MLSRGIGAPGQKMMLLQSGRLTQPAELFSDRGDVPTARRLSGASEDVQVAWSLPQIQYLRSCEAQSASAVLQAICSSDSWTLTLPDKTSLNASNEKADLD